MGQFRNGKVVSLGESAMLQSMRKVIFLDFDGVTHPDRDLRYFHHALVERVDRLRREHQAQVVISSNWRCRHPLPELETMIKAASGISLPILEMTPGTLQDEKLKTRGGLIKNFLNQREQAGRTISRFVILDDLPEWHFKGLERHLVSCNPEIGFDEACYQRASAILTGDAGEC